MSNVFFEPGAIVWYRLKRAPTQWLMGVIADMGEGDQWIIDDSEGNRIPFRISEKYLYRADGEGDSKHKCFFCNGNGSFPLVGSTARTVCFLCRGLGKVWPKCNNCNGSGEVTGFRGRVHKCSGCKGSGRRIPK